MHRFCRYGGCRGPLSGHQTEGILIKSLDFYFVLRVVYIVSIVIHIYIWCSGTISA